VCGDQSRRMATSDEDAMNDESDSAVDSVEAVGFSPRFWHGVGNSTSNKHRRSNV